MRILSSGMLSSCGTLGRGNPKNRRKPLPAGRSLRSGGNYRPQKGSCHKRESLGWGLSPRFGAHGPAHTQALNSTNHGERPRALCTGSGRDRPGPYSQCRRDWGKSHRHPPRPFGGGSGTVSEGQHDSLPRKNSERKGGMPPCGTKPARRL